MANHNPETALDIGRKLRDLRLKKGLSLRELAEKAEVSASLLSQIENGKANPSVRSLYSIAEALSLPVNYFFPTDQGEGFSEGLNSNEAALSLTASELRVAHETTANEALQIVESIFNEKNPAIKGPVVRANARSTIELQGHVTWSRLTPGQEDDIEFLQVCYDVGATSGAKFSRHPGREFGLILKGELTVELGFDSYLLKPGDSIIFDSETPHRLSNNGDVPVQATWVIFNRH